MIFFRPLLVFILLDLMRMILMKLYYETVKRLKSEVSPQKLLGLIDTATVSFLEGF